jgi:hypothetical protein
MTRFLDGPARGVALMLRRAPLFLRVTRDADGNWDALDQLRDMPDAGESIVVYRRRGKAGALHIDYTRKASAWFAVAEYELAAVQPADEAMRSTRSWRAWCVEQVKTNTNPAHPGA